MVRSMDFRFAQKVWKNFVSPLTLGCVGLSVISLNPIFFVRVAVRRRPRPGKPVLRIMLRSSPEHVKVGSRRRRFMAAGSTRPNLVIGLGQ